MVVLTSFTQPTDGIRHRQNNTTVYVNDNNLGKGTLFIAESRLSWVSDSGNGFSIEYPYISLHAISRDLSSFPQECLFLMLDTTLGDGETNNGDGGNDIENENDSNSETTEIRLVPDDRGMLDAMFHAMNVCQALHPDPEDSFSDEDFYEDADDEVPMEEADHRMAGLHIGDTEEMEDSILRTLEGGVVPEGLAPLLIRSTSWDRGVGTLGDREAGREVDREVDREVGILEDRGVGTLGDREADREVDMEVNTGVLEGETEGSVPSLNRNHVVWGRMVDRVGDMGVDRVVGMAVDMGVNTGMDRVGDMVAGRVVDRGVGTLDRGAADRVVDRAADRVVGRMARLCTARGDISFSPGCNSSQSSPTPLHSSRTTPENSQDENYFDDAEN